MEVSLFNVRPILAVHSQRFHKKAFRLSLHLSHIASSGLEHCAAKNEVDSLRQFNLSHTTLQQKRTMRLSVQFGFNLA
jgi:hypothetical protein